MVNNCHGARKWAQMVSPGRGPEWRGVNDLTRKWMQREGGCWVGRETVMCGFPEHLRNSDHRGCVPEARAQT